MALYNDGGRRESYGMEQGARSGRDTGASRPGYGPGRVEVHNRVKLLRHERGLSRAEMAEALGINHRTVGYIEREEYNVKLELAYRIANLFGLPLEAVFSQSPLARMSEQIYGANEGG